MDQLAANKDHDPVVLVAKGGSRTIIWFYNDILSKNHLMALLC